MNVMMSAVATAARHELSGERWPRWTAMAVGLAIVLSLVVATPASAATLDATFTVDAWTRDAQDERLVDFAFTLTVDGCGSGSTDDCGVWIDARYADAHTDQWQARLASFDVRDRDQDGEVRQFSASGVQVAPTTTIRAHIRPGSGETTVIDVPIADSYQYPAPNPSAALVQFDRDPNEPTQASWQVDLDFEGMGSPGAPCWETNTANNRCYFQVRLEHRSQAGEVWQWGDSGYVIATDSATGHSPARTVSGSGTLAPVTHAVVKIYGAYGTHLGSQDNPYVFEIPVADPAAAVGHTEATGDEIEAAMGLEDGEVPDEAVQAAITSMAMMDEAEILLALAAAPCPEINSTFNECMKAFANAMAAGASKVAALSRVTRITGGAVIVAVAVGVVGAEELDGLPPGEFPPPSEDPPKPVPPPGVGTFDPYTDPAPAAWVGTAEFDAAIEESRRVAEAVQVGVALLEDVCRQVLLGEIAAPQDVYDACQRFLVTPHPTLEDALRLLALGASDWEHHARIIDDLLAWATPLDYIEGEVAVNPFAPLSDPWVPSYQHELALTSCGLDNEALADMIEIARATNQWIRDHDGSVTLHRTTDDQGRLNDLGRQARVARDGWKDDRLRDFGSPIPNGYHASHLADTTVTGLPRTDYGKDGFEVHRAEANIRIGGALGNRLQHGSGVVTVVTVDGQFVGTLDSPIDIERLC